MISTHSSPTSSLVSATVLNPCTATVDTCWRHSILSLLLLLLRLYCNWVTTLGLAASKFLQHRREILLLLLLNYLAAITFATGGKYYYFNWVKHTWISSNHLYTIVHHRRDVVAKLLRLLLLLLQLPGTPQEGKTTATASLAWINFRYTTGRKQGNKIHHWAFSHPFICPPFVFIRQKRVIFIAIKKHHFSHHQNLK